MPTSKFFESSPAFPTGVPLAPLPKVSLQGLQNGSLEEASHLYDACRQLGFFLIDLRQSEQGDQLLSDVERMFELTTDTFALDQATLQSHAYKPPHDLTGYKQKGMLKTDDGKKDRMELYSINQDDMMGNKPSRTNAPSIEAKRPAVKQFIENSHAVVDVILRQLEDQMGLQLNTLTSLSPLDQGSETSVRLLLAQPQTNQQESDAITLGGHTDIGTITLLFNVIGGLQILPAGSEKSAGNWRYIKPAPGCAIVNIGDTLVEWTGGLLRSSLHRVVAAPGDQAAVVRRSIAYLVRPKASATMRRLVGGKIPKFEGNGEAPANEKSVNEWAAWRTKQIILGELKPETNGGMVDTA